MYYYTGVCSRVLCEDNMFIPYSIAKQGDNQYSYNAEKEWQID